MELKMRTIQRYEKGEWAKVLFKDLKKDDLFMMFDGPYNPVISSKGYLVSVCKEDPFPTEPEGNWGVCADWVSWECVV